MSAYSQKRTFAIRYLSFDRFRAVLDGTDRARYRVANATKHQNATDVGYGLGAKGWWLSQDMVQAAARSAAAA
jgi:hypothetical protein